MSWVFFFSFLVDWLIFRLVSVWRPAGYWNLDIHVLTDVQTG